MILILTPLAIELKSLNLFFSQQGFSSQIQSIGSHEVHVFKEQAIMTAVGGHGKVEFALKTQFFLQNLKNLKAVVCAGAAGSLTKSVIPGDLVVSTKTIEHDYNLKFVKKPLPEFEAHAELLNKVISFSPNKYSVHKGSIASGDEDVIDPARAQEIFQKTGALAVAWEGAGGARACAFNNTPFIEIRAITDSANDQAVTDFKQHVQLGMARLAEMIIYLQRQH